VVLLEIVLEAMAQTAQAVVRVIQRLLVNLRFRELAVMVLILQLSLRLLAQQTMDLAVVVAAEGLVHRQIFHLLVPLAYMAEVLGLELIQVVPALVLL